MLTALQSPYIQLSLFFSCLLITLIIKGLNEACFFNGIFLMLFWMLVVGVLGLSPATSWSYYLMLAGTLILEYAALVLIILACHQWGPDQHWVNGEGFIAILLPITGLLMYPVLFVVKAIWQLIDWAL